jgi:hypothetical protein
LLLREAHLHRKAAVSFHDLTHGLTSDCFDGIQHVRFVEAMPGKSLPAQANT